MIEDDYYDCIDDHDEPSCKFCNGSGYISVERGSSLSYPCTDCNDECEEDE